MRGPEPPYSAIWSMVSGGASSNAVIAHPLGILRGVDHLYTGRVERIDVDFIQKRFASGIVPVIPPRGREGDGHSYRVNSDSVAVEVAEEPQAQVVTEEVAEQVVHLLKRRGFQYLQLLHRIL